MKKKTKKSDCVIFEEALSNIRVRAGLEEDGTNKNDEFKSSKLGTDFEKLMVEFFKHDNLYSLEFKEVKRWNDWFQEIDTGIDIIARDKDDDLVGIQCKCWADNSTLYLDDFETMFITARAKNIKKLIVVFTGESISPNTQTNCEGAGVKIIMKSDLSKSKFCWEKKKIKHEPFKLKPHQEKAVSNTISKFKETDRGKLIMACGTGKTLTSLHIAEKQVGKGGLILYLVPSISLIPQTMREWADNRSIPHRYIAVCSDKSSGEDEDGSITEIPITPSTSIEALEKEYEKLDRKNTMSVVFSTYNSVEVASEALLKHDKNTKFDLILFDEAHKTTGVEKIKESYYLLAHNNPTSGKRGVPAEKRLYMTATPRVYKRIIKKKNKQESELKIYSMDDEKIYGEEFYNLEFSEAIKIGELSEYKIIMREVDESDVYGKFIQSGQEEGENINDYGSIDMKYMAKVGGILKGITYPDGDDKPPRPLQRVMVFHNLIKKSKIFAGHGQNQDIEKKPLKIDKTTKKALSFDHISKRLISTDPNLKGYETHTRHVDGSTNSRNRGERIDWLRRSDNKPKEIRILSNARCLQEGVDVPALDAVVFMDPKKSPIDIIQSIGRVMRISKGKEHGNVIIPIPILSGDNPKHALEKNKRYEQINEVLQALLAHDNRLRAILNNQMLVHSSPSKNRQPPDKQEITPQLREWLEKTIEGDFSDELLEEIKITLLELGDDSYYKRVGEELGEQSVIIKEMLNQRIKVQPETAKIINNVHKNLKSVVGTKITLEETVESLAQHTVMERVFVELFPDYKNPILNAFNDVLDKLNIKPQLQSLEKYYLKIKYDIEQFKTPEAKQKFILLLYDAFFRGANKKSAVKHGIVHTPIVVVDFIIKSVNHVLEEQFKKSFNDTCIKILDPFSGTGIFIAQLMELDMISPDKLESKYKNDIYANEIMIPQYYISMANIETTYQKIKGERVPFENISLMDTFDQHPSYRLDGRYRQKQLQISDSNLKEAQSNIKKQGMETINVIVGNPPYSGGQKTGNDDNKATRHDDLENKIKDTYVEKAPKGNTRGLYNSYIKALRWASDRIGDCGVIGFITPSAYITGNSEAGIRSCLEEEFTDVYCFDLRGDVKNKEKWKEEGGKIFGQGSTIGTAIIILVKNPKKETCNIHYYNIGDCLKREDKLKIIDNFKSIKKIDWEEKIPDEYHDWLNQRGESDKKFKKYTPIGNKKQKGKNPQAIFDMFSNGLKTHRDEWVYNSSLDDLEKNMKKTINHCKSQDLDNFDKNSNKVAWSEELSKELKKLKDSKHPLKFNKEKIRVALFRPFIKQFLYFDPIFVTAKYRIPSFFPSPKTNNLNIIVPDKMKGEFSTMISNKTPDLQVITNGQSFPLKTKVDSGASLSLSHKQSLHSRTRQDQGRVLSIHNESNAGSRSGSSWTSIPNEDDGMKDNITNWALERFQKVYPNKPITKEDIFFYTYGVLHSKGYRSKHQPNLVRGIPNIPMAPDFWAFNKAGRELADLHLNYEKCERYNLGEPKNPIPDNPRSIKFGENDDQTKLIVGDDIIFEDLPIPKYKVNGKTPVGWLTWKPQSSNIIDRDLFRNITGKELHAMIERLVYVGLKSDEIIDNLPKEFDGMEFDDEDGQTKLD